MAWLFLLAASVFQSATLAQVTNIYSTGFELSEGFDTRFTLIGQDGWTGTDVNGNGIVTNFFLNTTPQEPFGQQRAFVGFWPLTNADGILNVWRPLNFDPVAAGFSVVTFSVTMGIYDSVTTTNRDCFRWSVYNQEGGGTRLFTLDFDNTTTQINYELDDEVFVPTGYAFERSGLEEDRHYDLVVTMNFADNLWSATFNDFTIVDSKPITTTNSVLNLGDVEAVWVNREIDVFGDNFMVFDNYSVQAEPGPFWVDPVPRLNKGAFLLRLTGEPTRRYAIDATIDLLQWFPLYTNSVDANGIFYFEDATATNYDSSFYRARLVQ